MNRTRLLEILSDLVAKHHLTLEAAQAILVAYDEGRLTEVERILAIHEEKNDNGWLLLLLLLLRRMGITVNRALTNAERKKAAQLLRRDFEGRSTQLSLNMKRARITVGQWGEELYTLVGSYAREMSIAGVGQLPSLTIRTATDLRIVEQIPFIQRFALQIQAGLLLNRPMSPLAISARSHLYGGVGWGSFFAGQGEALGPGWVEQWITHDDRFVCRRCAPRHRRYFLPGEGPMPGWDCYGVCRCRRVPEYNPEVYAELSAAPVAER